MMSTTENALEASLPSTEFEQQVLMITVPEHKETLSPESSLSDLSQKTTLFSDIRISLQGFNASLKGEMENQEASSSTPSNVIDDSKTPRKIKNSAPDSSKPPENKNNILTDPAILTSIVMPDPAILTLSQNLDLHRDDSLTSELTAEKFQFKPHLTLL